MKRSKLKSKGRAAKHGTFNGSTLQLFKRISEGKGRSYLRKQAEKRALARSAATRMGVVIITGRKVGNG